MKDKRSDGMDMPVKWFEYDWQVEGLDAVYAVDTTLIEGAPHGSAPYLFYISCMTQDGSELSNMQTNRIAAMIRKCKRLLPFYAGRICTEDHHQFYFYGGDKKVYRELGELCNKQKRLLCRAGRMSDPEWSTYFELLYPNEYKYQTELNRRTIERYEKKGDGLVTPRKINMYCYFPTEALLVQFCEDARLSGFALGKHEYSPESELSCGTSVHMICPLEKRRIDALTIRAMQIAARYEGKLTHWDTQLMHKRAPMT